MTEIAIRFYIFVFTLALGWWIGAFYGIKWMHEQDDWTPAFPPTLPEYDVPIFAVYEDRPEDIFLAMLYYEDGWLWAVYVGSGAINDPTNYEADDDYKFDLWRPMIELPEVKDDR